MYIIAGLGNPGKEYENTRHNIGVDVIDRLAEEENIAVMEEAAKTAAEAIRMIITENADTAMNHFNSKKA